MAALSLSRLRTARTPDGDRPRTAFVLSGGGNQGVGQVGMLQALVERGVVPDVVVGCSVGALNGAAVALSPTVEGVETLADVWRSLRTEDVFPGGRLSRAWNVLTRSDHLFSDEGLRTVIRRLAPLGFEDLQVPLRVVACDFATGEEVVLASGPLEPALLASAALPGVLPPVRYDGRVLIDGGVVDNIPLRHALAGPVERVYVLNVASGVDDRPVRYPLDVLLQAFTIARHHLYGLELATLRPEVEVVTLPRPSDGRSIFDFSGSETIIEEAYALTARLLDELEQEPDAAPKGRRRWLRRVEPREEPQEEPSVDDLAGPTGPVTSATEVA